MDFTEAQVDQAIEFVIRNGAEDRAQGIAYTRVFDAGGLPAPQLLHQGGESESVRQFMKAFHDRCFDRGLPPLDALVVHVAGPRQDKPGAGYFKVNGWVDPYGERASGASAEQALMGWAAQLQECFDWGIQSRRGRRGGGR